MIQKKELRKEIRERKRDIPVEELREMSRSVCKRLLEEERLRDASTVMMYYPLADEVDVTPVIERLWEEGKTVVLPKVTGETTMVLHRYAGKGDLKVGAFGILEPCGEVFDDYEAIDVAVIPGMAFDSVCHRLGRGKGYYDSISSVTGSFIGTSSVTAYIESSSGVSVGGRTGLTAVVVGLLFLLVIFLSPLAGMVPGYAAAGALIYVGVLMTSSLARVNWQDLTESVPAFITAVMMPFSFSITEGIALGFISYCVMKIGTGRLRDLSPCVIIVALLFILKIVFIDAH